VGGLGRFWGCKDGLIELDLTCSRRVRGEMGMRRGGVAHCWSSEAYQDTLMRDTALERVEDSFGFPVMIRVKH